MSISCDMVIDLISLYHDGAASEDSRRAVREHLRTCPSCAAIYRQYEAELASRRHGHIKTAIPAVSLGEEYKKLAKVLQKRKMTDTLSATLLTSAAIIGALALFKKFIDSPDD